MDAGREEDDEDEEEEEEHMSAKEEKPPDAGADDALPPWVGREDSSMSGYSSGAGGGGGAGRVRAHGRSSRKRSPPAGPSDAQRAGCILLSFGGRRAPVYHLVFLNQLTTFKSSQQKAAAAVAVGLLMTAARIDRTPAAAWSSNCRDGTSQDVGLSTIVACGATVLIERIHHSSRRRGGMTRAAAARPQMEWKGVGAGDKDVEQIDEAIMGLQVGPGTTAIGRRWCAMLVMPEAITHHPPPPPMSDLLHPAHQMTEQQEEQFASSVFQIGLRRSSPRVSVAGCDGDMRTNGRSVPRRI